MLDSEYAYTGSRARLLSPILSRPTGLSGACTLRMFYHMYGATIGQLRILRRNAIGGPETELFSREKELGDYWERIDIDLSFARPFQIVIEAVAGNGKLGNIAIDDISLTPDCVINNDPFPTVTPMPTTTTTPRCASDQFECKGWSSQCINASKVCDFVSDCSDGSDEAECGECDFEKSTCGWRDGNIDEFRWIRKQAPSDNINGKLNRNNILLIQKILTVLFFVQVLKSIIQQTQQPVASW